MQEQIIDLLLWGHTDAEIIDQLGCDIVDIESAREWADWSAGCEG